MVKQTKEERLKTRVKLAKKRDELWRAIEILCELGERDLAYKLRVVHDSNFVNWTLYHDKTRVY